MQRYRSFETARKETREREKLLAGAQCTIPDRKNDFEGLNIPRKVTAQGSPKVDACLDCAYETLGVGDVDDNVVALQITDKSYLPTLPAALCQGGSSNRPEDDFETYNKPEEDFCLMKSGASHLKGSQPTASSEGDAPTMKPEPQCMIGPFELDDCFNLRPSDRIRARSEMDTFLLDTGCDLTFPTETQNLQGNTEDKWSPQQNDHLRASPSCSHNLLHCEPGLTGVPMRTQPTHHSAVPSPAPRKDFAIWQRRSPASRRSNGNDQQSIPCYELEAPQFYESIYPTGLSSPRNTMPLQGHQAWEDHLLTSIQADHTFQSIRGHGSECPDLSSLECPTSWVASPSTSEMINFYGLGGERFDNVSNQDESVVHQEHVPYHESEASNYRVIHTELDPPAYAMDSLSKHNSIFPFISRSDDVFSSTEIPEDYAVLHTSTEPSVQTSDSLPSEAAKSNSEAFRQPSAGPNMSSVAGIDSCDMDVTSNIYQPAFLDLTLAIEAAVFNRTESDHIDGCNSRGVTSAGTASAADPHNNDKRHLSKSSSVISGPSRRRQRVNTETEGRHASVHTDTISRRLSSLSLKSYTSSLKSDIRTALRLHSQCSRTSAQSSRFSQRSSNMNPILENVDDLPRTQAVTLRDPFKMDPPIRLPGQFIEDDLRLQVHYLWKSFMLNHAVPSHLEATKVDTLKNTGLVKHDRFNNTVLHAAAAESADYEVLISLMETSGSLNALNTAGQSFMHVLDPSTLIASGMLPRFLRKLRDSRFNFSKKDHQGVNILHVLLQYPLDHMLLHYVFETLRPHLKLLSGRDNLGRSAQSRLSWLAYGDVDESLRVSAAAILDTDFGGALDMETFDSFSSGCLFPSPLLRRALDYPESEDSCGRNGLHCIAQHSSEDFASASWFQDKAPTLDDLVQVGVDAQSYDKTGRTPLLALLCYYDNRGSSDPEDKLKKLVLGLIRAGASVHSRNREGQSPLHLAVKRGFITATRILINEGANVNARDMKGTGIVQGGIEALCHSECQNLRLRITLCIDLVREHGADDNPTMHQEWSS